MARSIITQEELHVVNETLGLLKRGVIGRRIMGEIGLPVVIPQLQEKRVIIIRGQDLSPDEPIHRIMEFIPLSEITGG